MGLISSITGNMGRDRPAKPAAPTKTKTAAPSDPATTTPSSKATRMALVLASPVAYLSGNWSRLMKKVDDKIEKAEAQLAEAERAYEAAALEAVDNPGCKALAAAETQLEAARRQVGQLRAARRAASTMQQQEATAAAEAERKAAWKATAQACRKRADAAERIDKAIEEFGKAYAALREATAELHRTCPASLRFNQGATWETTRDAGIGQAVAHASDGDLIARRISTNMREGKPTVSGFVASVNGSILAQEEVNQ